MIITTNVSLLSLNALRVAEIIRKATSIVATCSVSPPKVYQMPWRLWTTRREAAYNRRSLTFNNGAGHIIVVLHNGRSSLPLKTSQGSIPAPGNGTAPARGGAAAMSQPLGRLTKSVYLLWGEGTCESTGHKSQAPDSTPWQSPNR